MKPALGLRGIKLNIEHICTVISWPEAENSRVEGTVTAIFNLGCLFSALSCIYVGDILGRKRTFILGLIITIIGSLLQVSAFSLPQLTIGGFVAGFGFGGVTATGPNCSVTWRLPLAFPCFLCLISLCWAPVWPDSPRWLIKKGRIGEAREILAMLRDEPSDSPSLMGQQICGASAITFYRSTIFKNYLGMSGNLALLMSAVLFTWKMIIAPVGALTIDKAGRRKLLLLAFAGMGICMAVMAGCISQSYNKAAVDTAVEFIFLYVFFYVTGCIGLTYLYCSEIAPLAVRTQITGMSTASSWTFNFLLVEVTPSGFSSLGWKYFIIYAAINLVLLVPMVYFLFPETESLHLEVIDNIFLDSKHVFQPVSAAKSLRKHARRQGAHGELQVYEKATEEHKEVV
ncbi:major facilitator superfamily domain-containing protein [Aspergillus pseudocaelatus]|uniref:Major facilitator superfamily domain-containing protein n=1 Tax=Aspergillus pseudocaelatus TaxID=1825620 RepID=A0ABQ6WP96_9EURO|nr:major facilitator superfamily domain-containing protein [Aspergillus pseudocaelatus]